MDRRRANGRDLVRREGASEDRILTVPMPSVWTVNETISRKEKPVTYGRDAKDADQALAYACLVHKGAIDPSDLLQGFFGVGHVFRGDKADLKEDRARHGMLSARREEFPAEQLGFVSNLRGGYRKDMGRIHVPASLHSRA